MNRGDEEARLVEFGTLRNEAWRIVRDDIAALQADLDERGIGGRIKDRIGDEAHDVWDQTREIAAEHKGIVAATVAALVAWLLRGPIGEAISSLLAPDEEQDASQSVDSDEGDDT